MAYAATIGFFDGVHLGHRFLLARLIEQAHAQQLQAAVITFDEHPQSVLTGQQQPLLTTLEQRTALLQQQGVEQVFCFRFELIKDYSAEQFLQLLYDSCQVRMLLMGYDHTFGADQLSPQQYEHLAQRLGIQLIRVPALPEQQVSSSLIRQAIQQGQIERATQLLGHPFTLCGTVVHGRAVGRELGFPTANIQLSPDQILPPDGVYITLAHTTFGDYQALVNIGCSPTFNIAQRSVEVHIPSFEADLYDTTISLEIVRFLRPEMHFDSASLLQQQIARDLQALQQ